MRVVHAIVTEAFAGTERYVADVSAEQVRQGLEVTVIGGRPLREQLGSGVRWMPGGHVLEALRSATRLHGLAVAHGHLTHGELVVCATRARHGGRCLATRHLATPRGRSFMGGLVRPVITRGLAGELAISDFVSKNVSDGRLPVLHNGVPEADLVDPTGPPTALMAQRLEAEKGTDLGLAAWFGSQLPALGWTLLVAGEGSQRAVLERLCDADRHGSSVHFLGHVKDMQTVWNQTNCLLAPAPAEPLGLTVLEAMARGIPVVAAAGGGHVETLGTHDACLFPVDDVVGAATRLDGFAECAARRSVGAGLRLRQRKDFSLEGHVGRLTDIYTTL